MSCPLCALTDDESDGLWLARAEGIEEALAYAAIVVGPTSVETINRHFEYHRPRQAAAPGTLRPVVARKAVGRLPASSKRLLVLLSRAAPLDATTIARLLYQPRSPDLEVARRAAYRELRRLSRSHLAYAWYPRQVWTLGGTPRAGRAVAYFPGRDAQPHLVDVRGRGAWARRVVAGPAGIRPHEHLMQLEATAVPMRLHDEVAGGMRYQLLVEHWWTAPETRWRFEQLAGPTRSASVDGMCVLSGVGASGARTVALAYVLDQGVLTARRQASALAAWVQLLDAPLWERRAPGWGRLPLLFVVSDWERWALLMQGLRVHRQQLAHLDWPPIVGVDRYSLDADGWAAPAALMPRVAPHDPLHALLPDTPDAPGPLAVQRQKIGGRDTPRDTVGP